LVNLLDLNGHTYVPIVAAGPALLAFILVFLNNGITKHLLEHPALRLSHGSAYNYDTVLTGIMIAINSMLGLPWLAAATVRSLSHLHALSEKSPDGKVIYSVLETRLTALFAHGLILASLFALEIIRLIPVPVLYGVFLYMGLTTLPTNQFWNRFLLYFMEPAKFTQSNTEPFIENVKTWRIHMYTGIQLFLLVMLFVIENIKAIAIIFPIVIAICIPVRIYVLPKLFTQDELILLDSGDDEELDEWLDNHGRQRKVHLIDPKQYVDIEIRHGSLYSGSDRDGHSMVSSVQNYRNASFDDHSCEGHRSVQTV
jgi:hypothetical protein